MVKGECSIKEVDFHRSEFRYFVPETNIDNLFSALESNFRLSQIGSPPQIRTVVQTFYFGQNGLLPENVLLRLRKYNNSPSDEVIKIHPEDVCILEVKSSPDGGSKQWKEREQIKAGRVLEASVSPSTILSSIESARQVDQEVGFVSPEVFNAFIKGIDDHHPLDLILATEAIRYHWINTAETARITVDTSQKYFGFLNPLVGEIVGKESNAKVECKLSKDDNQTYQEIKGIIESCNGFPIDSRKQHIQSLYTNYLKGKNET